MLQLTTELQENCFILRRAVLEIVIRSKSQIYYDFIGDIQFEAIFATYDTGNTLLYFY